MITIKRIVAAIDFSTYSEPVLAFAGDIAAMTGAEIIGVHVINSRSIDAVEKLFHREGRDFSRKKFVTDETYRRSRTLQELLDQALPQDVSHRGVIRAGVPFEEVLAVVDEEQGDLLVVGSKGASNLKGVLFGTTSEKLYRHAPVSILTVNKTS